MPSGSWVMKLAGPEIDSSASCDSNLNSKHFDFSWRWISRMSGKGVKGLGLVVPARVEGDDVAFKHPLEEAYRVAAVPENQPVLGPISPTTSNPSFSWNSERPECP